MPSIGKNAACYLVHHIIGIRPFLTESNRTGFFVNSAVNHFIHIGKQSINLAECCCTCSKCNIGCGTSLVRQMFKTRADIGNLPFIIAIKNRTGKITDFCRICAVKPCVHNLSNQVAAAINGTESIDCRITSGNNQRNVRPCQITTQSRINKTAILGQTASRIGTDFFVSRTGCAIHIFRHIRHFDFEWFDIICYFNKTRGCFRNNHDMSRMGKSNRTKKRAQHKTVSHFDKRLQPVCKAESPDVIGGCQNCKTACLLQPEFLIIGKTGQQVFHR